MANLKFQNSLKLVAQNVPPVWMMRQAGRYHKHYLKLKEKHSFMELCKIPELAAETALGPVLDFDFDVSILFSDLLFPLEAMGMGLVYDPGPKLEFSLNESNFKTLKSLDDSIEFMEFQKKAVQATREVLPKDKSLIGFVGGAWTLFGYAVEGSHQGGLNLAKSKWNLFKSFNDLMIPFLRENIRLQLEGGAEVVMILDTAAGELSYQLFHEGVVPGILELAKEFPGKIGYYTQKHQYCHMKKFFEDKNLIAGFGFDHRWDLTEVFKLNLGKMIQGNFDQNLLFLDADDFSRKFKEYLLPIKNLSPEERKGWVCGVGHGLIPKTPEDNVRSFVNIVREVFS